MSYTYRQLFTKHLPEPYRSQAIANAIAQDRDVDDPSDAAGIDPEDLVEEIVEAAPVDPGTGYRLLEEGQTILEGDEEADEEEGGGWSKVHFTGDVYKPRNWYPVRRCDPGKGYRLVKKGEIVETGDEWLEDGQWVETGLPGPELCIDTPLRRKIAAPPAYRLLNPGEIIREGDEWYFGRRGHEWVDWVGAHGTAVDERTPPTRRPLKSHEDA